MRIALRLTLLAMSALAATAVATPSAFAQSEPLAHNQTPRLLVHNEVHGANDPICGAVGPSPPPVPGPILVGGGCVAHASASNFEFWLHNIGGGTETLISTCSVELNLRIDFAGEGYVTHQEFTDPPGGGDCALRACGQVNPESDEGRAWSFYISETEPAPTERLTMLLCFSWDAPTTFHCEVTFAVSQPTMHNYRFTATDAAGHGPTVPPCEIGSGAVPAVFDTESVLGVTNENTSERRLEIRHQ
jgi:hypothetical protein